MMIKHINYAQVLAQHQTQGKYLMLFIIIHLGRDEENFRWGDIMWNDPINLRAIYFLSDWFKLIERSAVRHRFGSEGEASLESRQVTKGP